MGIKPNRQRHNRDTKKLVKATLPRNLPRVGSERALLETLFLLFLQSQCVATISFTIGGIYAFQSERLQCVSITWVLVVCVYIKAFLRHFNEDWRKCIEAIFVLNSLAIHRPKFGCSAPKITPWYTKTRGGVASRGMSRNEQSPSWRSTGRQGLLSSGTTKYRSETYIDFQPIAWWYSSSRFAVRYVAQYELHTSRCGWLNASRFAERGHDFIYDCHERLWASVRQTFWLS